MKYFLSFIEEGIFNPKYFAYAGGRIEVYIPTEEYAIEEIRFLTKRNKEWNDFRDQYDFKDINKLTYSLVKRLVKKKYHVKTD